jgi:hypothetical protein
MAKEITILVVDDEADVFARRTKLLSPSLRRGVVVRHPDEVTIEDLESAKLVLVDFWLHTWAENTDEPVLAKKIPNGLALLSVLQQHLAEAKDPTAFAIHSEDLRHLSRPYGTQQRVHLLARAYNLDWAFEKSPTDTPKATFEMAHILAAAVAELPEKWDDKNADEARETIRQLLAIPEDAPWSAQAWRDSEAAHPPLDEMTLRVHGILLIRWLLTRVLYYPCFLINRFWLAARLGATPESIDASLNGPLKKFLAPALYTGLLEGFAGRRWWRAGVESLLWQAAGQKSAGTPELRSLLKSKHKVLLEPASHDYPVSCINGDYLPLDHVYDPALTVRLQLDDWPAHADPPRTTIETARADPRLSALVMLADRKHLIS